MFMQVVEHSWDAGESVEYPLLRARSHQLQHVHEVMMEVGKGNPTPQREQNPVFYASERSVVMASIEGWVIENTTS